MDRGNKMVHPNTSIWVMCKRNTDSAQPSCACCRSQHEYTHLHQSMSLLCRMCRYIISSCLMWKQMQNKNSTLFTMNIHFFFFLPFWVPHSLEFIPEGALMSQTDIVSETSDINSILTFMIGQDVTAFSCSDSFKP